MEHEVRSTDGRRRDGGRSGLLCIYLSRLCISEMMGDDVYGYPGTRGYLVPNNDIINISSQPYIQPGVIPTRWGEMGVKQRAHAHVHGEGVEGS